MPTETDLLILAAELDRADHEARVYALSHDAELEALAYVRGWVLHADKGAARKDEGGN